MIQRRNQEVTKVVSLCKNDEKHGVLIHLIMISFKLFFRELINKRKVCSSFRESHAGPSQV